MLRSARRSVERSGDLGGVISLTAPSDAERRLLIGITGNYRSATSKSVRVAVADIDQALRDRVGLGLLAVLARLHGPVRNRPAERAEEESERQRALDDAAGRCPAHRHETWFTTWLSALRSDGTVTRLVRRGESDMLGWAAEVLQRLPATSMPLPMLAELATGDTKALSGTPLAGLVLRALALREDRSAPRTRSEQRALWHTAGVIVDDLASQVLVLNVRTEDDHVVAGWLRDAATFGIPFRLTLHQLSVDPLHISSPEVYVCENPAVLRSAAGQLAEASATVVCTEGQPSAACHLLLSRARGRIHWRGDFDWTGLRTTAMAIERYHATPWRMSAQDYVVALNAALAETEPLRGSAAPSPWDPALAQELTRSGRAVMEERLIPALLADLTGG
jgi:uncharacterized protein (TIGR02679 family)